MSGFLRKRLKELDGASLEELLRAPVSPVTPQARVAQMIFGGDKKADVDSAALAGLTFGDLLYDALRVDPSVLEAADFARSRDLSSLFSFAMFGQELRGLPSAAFDGHVANLQGYVAERIVAMKLQSQGIEVEFPSESNQAGFDLLVNGEPFQVKCLATKQGVLEHLEKYPDIPVFVNEDLAESLEGVSGVFPIEGLRHADVVELTESSLEAADEMLDLEVPIFALAIAAGRAGWSLLRGTTDLASAIQGMTLDVGGGAAGGAAAAKVGLALGLMFGPAEGIILAALASPVGYRAGRRASAWVKKTILCSDEEAALEASAQQLLRSVAARASQDVATIHRKADRLTTCLDSPALRPVSQDVEWRLDQDLTYRKDRLALVESASKAPRVLDRAGGDIVRAAVEATFLAARLGVHPGSMEPEYRSLQTAMDGVLAARRRYHLR